MLVPLLLINDVDKYDVLALDNNTPKCHVFHLHARYFDKYNLFALTLYQSTLLWAFWLAPTANRNQYYIKEKPLSLTQLLSTYVISKHQSNQQKKPIS